MEQKRKLTKLSDNLVVFHDGASYVVALAYDNNLGFKEPQYFSTVKQAVFGAVSKQMRLKVKNGEITTLKQWVDEEKVVEAEIEKAFGFLDE